jgi:hypothetical protein
VARLLQPDIIIITDWVIIVMLDGDVSHLTTKDFDQVYEPGHDTWLLMDALKEYLPEYLIKLSPISTVLCLEVG